MYLALFLQRLAVMKINIYVDLPTNKYICRFTVVRLPCPQSGDNKGQKTFLTPSAG